MELYKEILVNALKSENFYIIFPDLKTDLDKIVENECYKALKAIKDIIENDELNDE